MITIDSRSRCVVVAACVLSHPLIGAAQSPSWIHVATGGPAPVQFPAVAHDMLRSRTLLFGGTRDGSAIGDMWSWDGVQWTRVTATGPVARTGAAATFDRDRGESILFGGFSPPLTLGDTWAWDGSTWVLKPENGPPARLAHVMTYDASRGRVVLFGGYHVPSLALYGDTWEWDGVHWTQRAMSGPAPRAHAALAYDETRHVSVLFGGTTAVGASLAVSGETWEWDGVQWTLRTTTGPSGRYTHAMAYDATRQVVVLYGGYPHPEAPLGDTWEWNGSTWSERIISGPGLRSGHVLAYEPSRHSTLLVGGYDPNIPNNPDTWSLACFVFRNGPANIRTCPSQGVSLAVEVEGPEPVNYQWQALGLNGWVSVGDGDSTGPFGYCGFVGSGATAPNIQLVRDVSCAASPPAPSTAIWRCLVSNGCDSIPSALMVVRTCPADYNCDGNLDPDDLGDFINCFFAVPPCPGADFNNDSNVDPDDLGDYINAYFAECP